MKCFGSVTLVKLVALLLLPLCLIWGGKVHHDRTVAMNTGLRVSWTIETFGAEQTYSCGPINLRVEQLPNHQEITDLTVDNCSYDLLVPPGKYRVVIDRLQSDVVQVRKGQLTDVFMSIN